MCLIHPSSGKPNVLNDLYKLDLSYSASLVSRYMTNPRKRHWNTIKQILRYLICSKCAKLIYQKATKSDLELFGYVDYDFVGESDKRISLTRYVFLYGPNLINLEANVQSIIALSTTEAECITLYETVKEGLWLKRLMKDF